jgi:16S rRNA (guanine527-N7)-methyltransferase
MILAFALPSTQVTLVEPLMKRASFLQFIKADLGLENVRVVKKRVEE